MITFDTNRLGRTTQRRFNVAWQEMEGETIKLLPQVAFELMSKRINPYDMEEGAAFIGSELERRGNDLTENERLWGQSVLWWAEEFLQDGTPYEVLQLSAEARERTEEVCQHLDRSAFPDANVAEPLSEHGDAVIVAQALVTDTKMLITNDDKIRHAVVHEWAIENAKRFDFKTPFILVLQDALFQELYINQEDFMELFAIVLGASWPADENATTDQIIGDFDRMVDVLEKGETGLRNIGVAIRQNWHREARKDDLIEYVRERLPVKMRASEMRHPARSVRMN